MKDLILSARYSTLVSNKAPHYHDCHQLLYITKGEADVKINNSCYSVSAGTLVLISRLEMHSIEVKSDIYERYEMRITPQISKIQSENPILYSVFINRPDGFCHANSPNNPNFPFLLERIVKEYKEKSPFNEDMIKLLFEILLISLFRSAPQLFSDNNQKYNIINRIQRRLESDIKKQYTLSMLAQEYHMSSYYLSHIFKSVTGYSVMEYLKSLRIAAAKRLLTKSDMPINEIVENCGFSDSSNFSRTFKALTGFTPSKFRDKYKN